MIIDDLEFKHATTTREDGSHAYSYESDVVEVVSGNDVLIAFDPNASCRFSARAAGQLQHALMMAQKDVDLATGGCGAGAQVAYEKRWQEVRAKEQADVAT